MRIILTGGGTGGHVTPAIAIAEEMKKIDKECKILFIGRDGGRENDAIKRSGFEYTTISVSGLRRSVSPQNCKALFLAIKAYASARRILKAFKPEIVVGTGGYVTWPVVRAAQSLGIPTVIHESNAVLGLATRLLSKRCDKVLINHESCASMLKKSVPYAVVGNPIRTDFGRISRSEARQSVGVKDTDTFIVSFGGSGGSEKMNEVVISVMENYSSKQKNLYHIHATGEAYYEKFSGRIKTVGKKCEIIPYIHDMPTMLRAADIVITRCGALTLSELSCVGVASILIPSPNVTADHQLKNGRVISKEGGAVLIEEKDLTVNSLKDAIARLSSDKALRARMSKCIEKFAIPNSRELCVREILSLRAKHAVARQA